MKPIIKSSETIYRGRIFEVRVDEIREGDAEYKREIVVHGGSAVIVPVFDDDTVALVRQYRHAAGKYLLEIPAGTLDGGENPEAGARRELEEEIGVRAAKVEKICEFYVSPGFLTEKMFVYLATGLTATAQKLEIDEILTVERYSFQRVFSMIDTGEIEDAKTIVGIYAAAAKLGLG